MAVVSHLPLSHVHSIPQPSRLPSAVCLPNSLQRGGGGERARVIRRQTQRPRTSPRTLAGQFQDLPLRACRGRERPGPAPAQLRLRPGEGRAAAADLPCPHPRAQGRFFPAALLPLSSAHDGHTWAHGQSGVARKRPQPKYSATGDWGFISWSTSRNPAADSIHTCGSAPFVSRPTTRTIHAVCTAVLPNISHSNCSKRVPNRSLRLRRGRFGTLLQLLQCRNLGRTAVENDFSRHSRGRFLLGCWRRRVVRKEKMLC